MIELQPFSIPASDRCLLRDTVVPIPEPEDLIVNYIEPSHVVVQRCTGKERNATGEDFLTLPFCKFPSLPLSTMGVAAIFLPLKSIRF